MEEAMASQREQAVFVRVFIDSTLETMVSTRERVVSLRKPILSKTERTVSQTECISWEPEKGVCQIELIVFKAEKMICVGAGSFGPRSFGLGRRPLLEPRHPAFDLLDLLLNARPSHEPADGPDRVASLVELQKELLRFHAENGEDGEDVLQLEVDVAAEELREVPLALAQGSLDLPLRGLPAADGFPQSFGDSADFGLWWTHDDRLAGSQVERYA
jgi:hypothetical protein